MEIWKDVIGYEGYYQVSNLGNVKSLSRIRKCKNNFTANVKERILKPNNTKANYLHIVLSKNGEFNTRTIHQLVAESFLNHIPNGCKLVVNHKNLNKNDNKVENLEIISGRDNTNKKHIPHSSKYTGVYWNKKTNKWGSQIRIDNQIKYLGIYNNEYDAHLAYEKELHRLKNIYNFD